MKAWHVPAFAVPQLLYLHLCVWPEAGLTFCILVPQTGVSLQISVSIMCSEEADLKSLVLVIRQLDLSLTCLSQHAKTNIDRTKHIR